MSEVEEWRDVEGFEGYYQISNQGRVKSLPRFKRKTERILKPTPNTTGYLIVGLRKPGEKVRSMLVHRLVLMAFEPLPCYENITVNHKNFDTQDNKISNLEWCTQEENNKHFNDYGVRPESTVKGESHHLSVLTAEKVLEIRAKHSNGQSGNSLSKEYGIGESTVRQVVNRVTWKDIQ
jgi:hypothetical protein